MDEEIDIESLVRSTLRETVEVHQRRCANRHDVRESTDIICDHSDWNHGKQWCNNCGVTMEDLCYGKRF